METSFVINDPSESIKKLKKQTRYFTTASGSSFKFHRFDDFHLEICQARLLNGVRKRVG